MVRIAGVKPSTLIMQAMSNAPSFRLVLPAVLFLVSTLAYLPSRQFDFFGDDAIHIHSHQGPGHLMDCRRSWNQADFPGNLYRPLTGMTFCATGAIFGPNTSVYRLTNIILHGATVVAGFLFFKPILSATAAALGAMLYAVHPLHVESVVSIVGRAELLAGLLALICLCWAHRFLNRGGPMDLRTAAGLCATSFLACSSKESAACLLILLPVTALWAKGDLRRIMGPLLNVAFGVGLYLILRYSVLGAEVWGGGHIPLVDNPLSALEWPRRLAAAASLLGLYLANSFFPTELGRNFSYAELSAEVFGTWPLLLGLVVCLAAIVLMISGLRSRSPWSFGLAWFFGSFAVTANILFPIGTAFAERLCYLPIWGVCLVIGLLLAKLRSKALVGVLQLLLVLVLSGQQQIYVPLWHSARALYSTQVRLSPNSAKAHLNYALVLKEDNDRSGARSQLSRALEILPSFGVARYSLGIMDLEEGRLEAAERQFKSALRDSPGYIEPLIGLARVEILRGRVGTAREYLEHAAAGPELHPIAGLLLMSIYIDLGELQAAEMMYGRLRLETRRRRELAALKARLDAVREFAP